VGSLQNANLPRDQNKRKRQFKSIILLLGVAYWFVYVLTQRDMRTFLFVGGIGHLQLDLLELEVVEGGDCLRSLIEETEGGEAKGADHPAHKRYTLST